MWRCSAGQRVEKYNTKIIRNDRIISQIETYMTDDVFLNLDPQSPTLLKNITCAYCGAFLEGQTSTKEHVIGRRFVPKGTLEKSWNLILRTCDSCNNQKSDLENDISAISMQPDAWGNHETKDEKLIHDSTRKGKKAVSRATGKPVNNSSNDIEIKYPFGNGINFKFNSTSPPRIDCHRVYELCRLQMMAFYYFLTYDEFEKRGYFWIGDFMPIMEVTRKDWGNNVHTSFMNQVANWDQRFFVIAADGFFKASIRKQPNLHCWSWALEWNQKYRIIGFIGDKEQAQENVSTFQQIKKETIKSGDNTHMHLWTEKPLKDKDDIMFSP